MLDGHLDEQGGGPDSQLTIVEESRGTGEDLAALDAVDLRDELKVEPTGTGRRYSVSSRPVTTG